MEQKQFKAESKRLLDMMIHSIYTHKEIFLRELISNASDAIDKLYFRSLTDDSVGMSKSDFKIRIRIDKEARTLTISDNGIGMTKEELENNLGIIANSGSLKFKSENNLSDESQIIGQFGVGFYSAFMVAGKVTVKSRAFGADTAYVWESEGTDGYTIDTCDKETVGTEITLEILPDAKDEAGNEESYEDYLNQYKIQSLVKRYSDYIRFPIIMDMTKSRRKADAAEDDHSAAAYEDYTEDVTLNSMIPIWRKNKSELSDEDYNNFYKDKFNDFSEPIAHAHVHNEGMPMYDALLYVPSRAPYDFYSKEYKKGLQLYANGVLIMDCCEELLPDYFCFVKGLVDSEDVSLNISREMLQHDAQLRSIAKSIEKTVKNELTRMMKNDRTKYEEFYKAFGLQLKYGVYSDYGMHKDVLQDLLMFISSNEGNPYTSLAEYVDRMPEGQEYIYYAAGESLARAESLPQTEAVKAKGYEVLYFTDNVDEFAIRMLMQYKDKKFKSVADSDLSLESDEEKKALEKKSEASKDMLQTMTKALEGKITAVKLSGRLGSHPVCLSSEGEITMEMAKTLNAMPGADQKIQAQLVLEVNPEHEVYGKLMALSGKDDEKLGKYAQLLCYQAMLIEGMPIEEPAKFAELICELI
ncbi:MAG: molecular chaperone HtpG [Oscillospiraceae bacterium]|nr:molecular chaperone HtpG [Oscillospiraceae bacterium]